MKKLKLSTMMLSILLCLSILSSSSSLFSVIDKENDATYLSSPYFILGCLIDG